jgi:putative endopeptidase
MKHIVKTLSCGLLLAGALQAQKPGINLSFIDSSASPANDFYTYSNGKWQKSFQLPESDARYGSFNEINENNLKKLKVIYDGLVAQKNVDPKSNFGKLRNFYVTAMDSSKADRLGLAPIQKQLDEIAQVFDPRSFLELKSKWDFIGIELLFSSGVSVDLKNSKRYLFYMSQGGYGLGDRDYYYSDKNSKIREAYQNYIANLLRISGVKGDSCVIYAKEVLAFETRLTSKAMTRVELRDPEKQYNPVNSHMVQFYAPMADWHQFMMSHGVTPTDSVIVSQPEYFKALDRILAETPVKTLRMYARARLMMEAAPYLTQQLVDINFDFRGKTMSGSKKMKARWQRVHGVINGAMGEVISEEFVKKHFTPEAKAKVNLLIDNLIAAYRERIASRTWMSDSTKKQAYRKLDLMIRKVGYPEKWKDYSELSIGTESYWQNVCLASEFLVKDNLMDLRKKVDRNKWQMTPITVNAYYDPTTNEITFPAAILQPPFFDANADDAANYGTMGAIIGHELTHGFDDQGAQFDADGNMKMWWTEADFKNFKERTALIVAQFNQYVAIDTLHVNGEMTQGENIADLGGLTMAYYAYKKSLKGKASPKIGGFTGEQRFFIAWAQGWKSVCRDAELKRLLTVDYHSPANFRAFAPLTNMPEFYEAFGVKPGDKMYTAPEKRVEIW